MNVQVSRRSRGVWRIAAHALLLTVAMVGVESHATTSGGLPEEELDSLCPTSGAPPDIVIPDDGTVYKITGNTTCGLITVEGRLDCEAGVTATLSTDGIWIDGGVLRCGTVNQPFDGQFIINITGNRGFSGFGSENKRSILVTDGGRIILHGETDKAGFTRLDADADKDTSSLAVESAAGWQAGDRIIVTTTSTYPDQNELLVLADDCPADVCTTSQLLSHFHYGDGKQTYSGAGSLQSDLTVDMRAYVANLRRNIRIRGANDSYWQNSEKGGHLMVMYGGEARIEGVEFNRMGQAGLLGRYPFHWHQAGSVDGQYLRLSSIRNSPNRCIALHNAHLAKVEDNVCFNVKGHAIFLENGNEVENTIARNLIVQTLEPDPTLAILQSDIDNQPSRWQGPAGIWISGPENYIEDNVVVDAGSGYWHPYVHNLCCYNDDPLTECADPMLFDRYARQCNYVPRNSGEPVNVHPVNAPTLSYKRNIAIATRVGHTWDGAPDGPSLSMTNEFNNDLITTGYAPSGRQNFLGMHAYKSGRTGIYYRGLAGTALIQDAVVAEAPIGWFGTSHQDYYDSLFVGVSENFDDTEPGPDFWYHIDPSVLSKYRGGNARLMRGVSLYDGPNHFKNVTFDFPSDAMTLGGKEVTPTPVSIFGRAHFPHHVFEDIHYVDWNGVQPKPYRYLNFETAIFPLNWEDVGFSESIYDADGSLFETTGSGFARPNIPFNDLPSCELMGNTAGSVLRCPEKSMTIKFQMDRFGPNADTQDFTAQRSDTGASASPPAPGTDKFTKFQMIDGAGISYRVLGLDFQGESDDNLVWIETFDVGDWSPLIIIEGASATNFAPGCSEPGDYKLEFWDPSEVGAIEWVTELNVIRNYSNSNYDGAYFQADNGSLLLKLKGKNLLPGGMDPTVFHTADTQFRLVCP